LHWCHDQDSLYHFVMITSHIFRCHWPPLDLQAKVLLGAKLFEWWRTFEEKEV
jgi:hypothetical protein